MRWLVALLVVGNILIFTLGRDGGPGAERVEVPARPAVGNLRLLSEAGADGTETVSPGAAAETGQEPVSTPAEVPSSPADSDGRPFAVTDRAPSGETAVDGFDNE